MTRWRSNPDNKALTPTWAQNAAKEGSDFTLGVLAGAFAMSRERRRLGAYLVHGGLIVIFLGVAFQSLYKTTREGAIVTLGNSFSVDVEFPEPSRLEFTLAKYEIGSRVDPNAARFRGDDVVTVAERKDLQDLDAHVQLLPDGKIPLAYIERLDRGMRQADVEGWMQQLQRDFPVQPTTDADIFFFKGNLLSFSSWHLRRAHTYDYARSWVEVRRDPEMVTLSPETLPADVGSLRLETDLTALSVPYTTNLHALSTALTAVAPELGITCDLSTPGIIHLFPTRAEELTVSTADGKWTVSVKAQAPFAVLYPEARLYYRGDRPMHTSEVGVHRGLLADEFLVAQEFMGASRPGGDVLFAFHHNPMIAWLWVGFVIMVIGTVIALLPPPRARAGAPTAASAADGEEESL